MVRFVLLSLAVCLLVGCGGKSSLPKTYPVKGTVSDAKGSPVKGGVIRFEPTPAGVSLIATIKDDGSFLARTFSDNAESAGLPVGEYKVTVNQLIPDGGNVPPPPVTLKTTYKVEAKDNEFSFRLGKD